jgi:hypothetical protein
LLLQIENVNKNLISDSNRFPALPIDVSRVKETKKTTKSFFFALKESLQPNLFATSIFLFPSSHADKCKKFKVKGEQRSIQKHFRRKNKET